MKHSRNLLLVAIKQLVRISSVVFNILVITRLTTPEEFAIISLATMVWAPLGGIRSLGIREFIIVAPNLAAVDFASVRDALRRQAWRLCLVCLAICPVLWFCYGASAALTLAALALSWIPMTTTVMSESILERRMDLGTLTNVEIIINLSGMAVAGGLALAGCGLAALVCNIAVPELVRAAIFSRRLLPQIPAVDYVAPGDTAQTLAALKSGFRRQVGTALAGIGSLERLILMHFFPAATMGNFVRIKSIISMAVLQFRSFLAYGMTVDARRSPPHRLDGRYLRTLGLVSAAGGGMACLGAVLAHLAIPLLLGPRWSAAVPMMEVLSPMIWTSLVFIVLEWKLVAADHAFSYIRNNLSSQLASLGLMFTLLWLGAGLPTAILSTVAIQAAIGLSGRIHAICRKAGCPPWTLLRAIAPGLFLACAGVPLASLWHQHPGAGAIILASALAACLAGAALAWTCAGRAAPAGGQVDDAIPATDPPTTAPHP